MDRQAVLAAFDEQIRRRPELDAPDARVEHDDGVIRIVSHGGGWSGVSWSALDEVSGDAVIAAQIARFSELSRPWEWKHYSYDRTRDLPERLVAAGLTRQPAEALLVAEVAALTLHVPPPPGVELRAVVDSKRVEALVSVHDHVFGAHWCRLGQSLARRSRAPADFASLWGGGTLPGWRGRGVFRSLVAYRTALASARCFRCLQVDASPDSRAILQRLGFVELATTTPFTHPGGTGSPLSNRS